MTMASPGSETQAKPRNWLLIVVGVVAFCCICSLCLVLFYYLYTNGDQLFGLARVAAGLM